MPKGEKTLREFIKGDLLIQINEIWRRGKIYHSDQNGDTIQDTSHCETVESNLCKLISDIKKENAKSAHDDHLFRSMATT